MTIGRTAYVLGGYDGPSLDPEVLATSNGVSFRNVTVLPVPVRYPAVATLGGLIYLFGGQSVDGRPVGTVQVVDPSAGTAQVIGRLPLALSGAAAGALHGIIYIAGGTTGASGASSSHPVRDIFAFDVAHASFLRAGSLPVAVANAGAAISANRLFLVGGETPGGVPTGDVQVVSADRAFGEAGATGAGSPFMATSFLSLTVGTTVSCSWTTPAR